jgi:hypothetical protein
VGSPSLRFDCKHVIGEGLQAEPQRRAKKLAGNFSRPIRERNSYIRELYSRIRESIKAPPESPLVGQLYPVDDSTIERTSLPQSFRPLNLDATKALCIAGARLAADKPGEGATNPDG